MATRKSRKLSGPEAKLVIAIRKDLNLSVGTMMAHVANTVMEVVRHLGHCARLEMTNNGAHSPQQTRMVTWTLLCPEHGPIDKWILATHLHNAISVVTIDSEAQLDELAVQARRFDVPCEILHVHNGDGPDLESVPTCIAIGPWLSEPIDHITQGLKPL